MAKPTILTVDDDFMVSEAITRDLLARYGGIYGVVRTTSGAEAVEVLTELALRDRRVALVLADQRMPGMTGIELLEQSRTSAPGAKLLLLTAYADTDVAIRAINEIGLDYYLLKPWDPPEDRLYPVVDDLLGDWQRGHPDQTDDVRVVGHRWSERSHEVKTFLARNHVPYRWFDVERDAEGAAAGARRRATPGDLPWCSCRTASRCGRRRRTTWRARSGCGRRPSSRCTTSASSAAVRPDSRQRCTPLRRACDRRHRAGGSRWAGRAERCDRELPRVPEGAVRGRPHPSGGRAGAPLRRGDGPRSRRGRRRDAGTGARRRLRRCGRDRGAALLVATGVSYRRLEAPGLDELTGRGVYYGATASDAEPVRG